MLLKVIVKTQAQIQPHGKTLSTQELYDLAKTVAGSSHSIEIDDSQTVQQLADKVDAAMNIDPALTILETIVDNGVELERTMTLAAAGVEDGAVLKYSYVIKA